MSVGNEAKHSGLRMTVIIPAFNEEAYLAATLDSIHDAAEMVRAGTDVDVETIVVDNNSRDATAAVARAKGAAVVREPVQSISRARNAGARHATGEVLIFIDADVVVPCALLQVICTAMGDPKCVGGGVDVDYHPRRYSIRVYLQAWRLFGRATGIVQGATQFSRKCVFEQTGGYDEGAWIGEDVDFY